MLFFFKCYFPVEGISSTFGLFLLASIHTYIYTFIKVRQDLHRWGDSFVRYSERCFTQIDRALYGDTCWYPPTLGPTWRS